jgi:CBS-domain-containing membrane protein
VAVVDGEGRAAGIVSEGDLIRRPELETDKPRSRWLRFLLSPDDEARDFVKTHGLRARDVMSRPALGVAPDTPLAEIVHLMGKQRVKRVLVWLRPLAGIVTEPISCALHAPKPYDRGVAPTMAPARLSRRGGEWAEPILPAVPPG